MPFDNNRPHRTSLPCLSLPRPAGLSRTLLSAAVAGALATPAQGQDIPLQYLAQAGTEIIDVESIRVGRDPASIKFARPLLDTAQTINVIPKDLIEQRGATSLRDVLRNVSGISMQAGEGGTPAGDQLSIRGFTARTDIFVDNVRDFGGYTRDPFNLEQVEVVKGPSSDYSGRGSTGGSVNLVSKTPGLEDNINTNLAVGSDNYSRFAVDMNKGVSSSAALRLNLLYHDQDVAGRNQVHNERWAIAPSLAFGLDGDTQTTVSLFHLQQDNIPDYGIPWVPAGNVPLADYADQAPPVDFENWYGLLSRDFEDTTTSMATVQVAHRFSGNVRVNNITRWGVTDRDSMITAPRFLGNDSTDIRRSDEKYRDQEDAILSNQTNLVVDINPGGPWEHRILAGMELSDEEETQYIQALTGIDSPATDLFNPTPGDAYLENYQRTGGVTKADSSSQALYLSDSIQVSEHWQVNGGLRWDRFELDYTPDGAATVSRTDTMTSYRAGIVYKPVPEGSVYVGYGTSFNPTAEALSISTSSRQPGIADLDPEENRTLEIGTKWELFDRNLMVTAAVFRTEKTNARTQDPTDPNDLLVLQGEQLVQGVELGVAGSLNDRFSLFAGYTYLDTEITDSLDAGEIGNALGNSPAHSFNVWGTYTLDPGLELGLGMMYVDDRYNSTANSRIAPGYWLGEASATWLLNDRVNVRLNVQNLTDEDYIDYVGGGHFIPGMGRLAMLSTNFSF